MSNTFRAFRCPHCGSTNVRRSLPRSLVEDVVRSLTPYHLYFCRDCESRGWKVGVLKVSDDPAPATAFGRQLEPRDTAARRRRWRRLLLTIVLAVALGVATGVRLHSCAQQPVLPLGSE